MHGGKRAGAGRKPAPVDIETIEDLAQRIRREIDPERRIVIAFSAMGAEPAIIAAALDLDEAAIAARHGRAIEVGRTILNANTINLLWRRGKTGNVAALIYLDKLSRRKS